MKMLLETLKQSGIKPKECNKCFHHKEDITTSYCDSCYHKKDLRDHFTPK